MMPKINVYVPDDLAAAVKAAGIPVSAVCQRALAQAVHAVGQARRVVETIRDPDFTPDRLPSLDRVGNGVTPRLARALELARQAAGAAGVVESRHLLLGMLDERDNLGVRVLESLEVDTDGLRAAAAAASDSPEPGPAYVADPTSVWSGLSVPARLAIASALESALALGHNYLGCEHLLLGLADGTSSAGELLAARGVDAASARRAVGAATTGYAHARQAAATTSPDLSDIVARLERLERRLGTEE